MGKDTYMKQGGGRAVCRMAVRLLCCVAFVMLQTAFAATAQAQTNDRDYIRMGNRAFKLEQYDKAETYYLKALSKQNTFEAFYNLGNAYLMQGKDSTGNANLQNADSLGTTNQLKRAMNYHNLGNVWYAQGASLLKSNQDATSAFQNAVNLYKSSLRCNPSDNETRYNLAKAMFQLKKSQQNQQNQQQQQQQQQQQNQDQQQQQQKQDQQQQPQPQNPKEEKNQMSEQTAEQLLNSARQDEKKVQQKVKQQDATRRSLEKDW